MVKSGAKIERNLLKSDDELLKHTIHVRFTLPPSPRLRQQRHVAGLLRQQCHLLSVFKLGDAFEIPVRLSTLERFFVFSVSRETHLRNRLWRLL